MSARSSTSLLVALVVGCGPQVVLDFETNGDSGDTGEPGSTTSGPASSTSVASTTTSVPTTMTAGPDPSVGDDGTGAPDVPSVCTYHCVRDQDCTFQGQDAGLQCMDGTCGSDSWTCASDEECVPILSGWASSPCTAGGGECNALGGLICVDLGDGSGGCASSPRSGLCRSQGWDEVVVTELDTGRLVVVCGWTTGTCHPDAYCQVPCSETGCGGLTCNPETNACECSDDAQCVALGLENGVCIDRMCIDACVTASDCENPFDGGFATCDPL